jgi:Flp pilus assembly protein TadD
LYKNALVAIAGNRFGIPAIRPRGEWDMAESRRSGARSRAALAAAVSVTALGCAIIVGGCDSLSSAPAKPVNEASLMNAQLQAAQQAEASYDYSDALSIYQTLYSQHQDNMDLGMNLARNLRFAGQAATEIGLINQFIAKTGRSVPLLLELGKAYLAADQDNLALPTLLEAKGKEPNNWEVLSTLGVAYDYQGSYADARDAYAQALIASPSNPTVLNNLALSQASSGDLDGAIATLQQAIDQPAAQAQTRQNLALLLALKGDPDSAERLARKDLPPEIADSNMAYFRMVAGAASKGGATPAAASAIMPAAAAAEPMAAPAASVEPEPEPVSTTADAPAPVAPIVPILPPPAVARQPQVAAPMATGTPLQGSTDPQDGEAVR